MPGLKFEKFNLFNLTLILDIFKRPLWNKAVKNSLMLSLMTTLGGVIVGGFLSFIRTNYKFPLSKLIDIISWILLIIPSFILAQGWIFFGAGNGIAKTWLSLDFVNNILYSFPGLVIIMVLSKFPLAYITLKSAFEWHPKQLINAARMNGANFKNIWSQIILPLSMPSFFSAALLVFMDTVGDYGMSSTITAAYPFPTLPYTIYSAVRTSPVRFDMAGILSLVLMFFIIIALIIQTLLKGRKRYDYLGTGTIKIKPQKVKFSKKIFLTIFTGIFCLISLGIPIGSTIIMSFSDSFSIEKFVFTLNNYKNVLNIDAVLLQGIKNSLALAMIAGIFGLLIGFFTSFILTYSKSKLKGPIDLLTLLSMAIPGVVIGIGYIFLWNQPGLKKIGLQLYGKPEILILASIAVAIPITNRILVSGMTTIPENLMIAAQIQGANFLEKIRGILLPLLHKTMVSALLTAFGSSVFNLAITSILYPPNFYTLPVYINTAYNNLNFGISAAATIIGGIFIILIMLLLEFVLNYNERKKDGKLVDFK